MRKGKSTQPASCLCSLKTCWQGLEGTWAEGQLTQSLTALLSDSNCAVKRWPGLDFFGYCGFLDPKQPFSVHDMWSKYPGDSNFGHLDDRDIDCVLSWGTVILSSLS